MERSDVDMKIECNNETESNIETSHRFAIGDIDDLDIEHHTNSDVEAAIHQLDSDSSSITLNQMP